MPLKAAQPLPFKHAANAQTRGRTRAARRTFVLSARVRPLSEWAAIFQHRRRSPPPGSALDRHWRAVARPRAMRSSLQASAETLPFDDYSMDTLVMTWTLCTIADVRKRFERTVWALRRTSEPEYHRGTGRGGHRVGRNGGWE